ncbi:MAG: type II toxin-antitoxin system RelE/ParE family toxin [Pirellulales bacterium]
MRPSIESVEILNLYERVYQDYRRAIVQRFPYVIFYEIDAETVVVYSVFHTAQDPRKWRERLK